MITKYKHNSYLRVKCKCSPECDRVPTISCYGYYYAHLPEDLKEKAGTRMRVAVKNKNKRVAIGKKLHVAQREANGDTFKSDLWFASKKYQMSGICACNCKNKTSNEHPLYWKFCIAHVLAKSKFKSIAWHPDNWIELAFFPGCHSDFDNLGYEHCKNTKPILWRIVVEKFKILYPFIHHSEYKHIPNVLLETLINI